MHANLSLRFASWEWSCHHCSSCPFGNRHGTCLGTCLASLRTAGCPGPGSGGPGPGTGGLAANGWPARGRSTANESWATRRRTGMSHQSRQVIATEEWWPYFRSGFFLVNCPDQIKDTLNLNRSKQAQRSRKVACFWVIESPTRN